MPNFLILTNQAHPLDTHRPRQQIQKQNRGRQAETAYNTHINRLLGSTFYLLDNKSPLLDLARSSTTLLYTYIHHHNKPPRHSHDMPKIPAVVTDILLQVEAYVTKRRCSFKDLFGAIDLGGDGDINLEELRAGLRMIGIRVDDANFLLLSQTFDPDGSGEIDFLEFVNALKMAQQNRLSSKEKMVQQKFLLQIEAYVTKKGISFEDLFRKIDLGGDGDINLEELRTGLDMIGIRVSDANFLLMKQTFDPDKSGEIDFLEFVNALEMVQRSNSKTDSKSDSKSDNKSDNKSKSDSSGNGSGSGSEQKTTTTTTNPSAVLIPTHNPDLDSGNVAKPVQSSQSSHTGDTGNSGKTGDSGENSKHAAIILNLKTALEKSEAKWKKKFEQLKTVLHEHHTTNLKNTLESHKKHAMQKLHALHEQHEAARHSFSASAVTAGKKDDRENTALRAKCARLASQVKLYKKIAEDHKEEKESSESRKGVQHKAKTHWSVLRNDMNKTMKAKDKFAEIMRQGTMKALRAARADALQDLAETRQNLKNANQEAEQMEGAFKIREDMQLKMNKQIELLEILVQRTDEEKRKYKEKHAQATKDKVKQRFTVAKIATSHTSNKKALADAHDEMHTLKEEIAKFQQDINAHEDLKISVALLTDQLNSNVHTISCLRGWNLFNGLSWAILTKTLRDKTNDQTNKLNDQQMKLTDQKNEINVLETKILDVKVRLENSVLISNTLKVTALQIKEERRNAQHLILSLASHTNNIMHSLTKQQSCTTDMDLKNTRMLLNTVVITPTPPAFLSTPNRKGRFRTKHIRDTRAVLCLLNVSNDSILTGWARSKGYQICHFDTTNRDALTQQQQHVLENCLAIVCFAPNSMSTVSEWLHPLTLESPRVVIVSNGEDGQDGVCCIRPPLTTEKLSRALALCAL